VKGKLILFLIIILFSFLISGCAPKDTTPSQPIVWQKTYGGGSDDEALSIQQTQDGGYIVAGYTNSFGTGESDVYVIKMDANGNTGPYPPTQGVSGTLKSMEKPFGSPFDKMFPHGFLKK